MDPEKIGKLIKQIRLQQNLSQQKFAEKYGVTYQAVSKWENGRNIPDLAILKQMCQEYNMNLDAFLETKISIHKKRTKLLFLIPIVLVLIVAIFLGIYKKEKPFELKGLAATCDNFTLYGSIAYSQNKTSIYISNISYCGNTNDQRYQKIGCVLYETNGKTKTEMSRFDSQNETDITLDDFLKKVKLNVDHYETHCKIDQENTFYLEIEAVDEKNHITTYKIPLQLEENCTK